MRVFHHDLTIMYHHHGISFMAKIDFAAISSKTKIMDNQTSREMISQSIFIGGVILCLLSRAFSLASRIFICSFMLKVT